MKPVRSIADWAALVAAMPAAGLLPTRTVIVPSETIAHVLRRAILRSGSPQALLGTRFASAVTVASDVLTRAGVDFTAGEEALRPSRVAAALRAPGTLAYFGPVVDRPGWDIAFARTIGDLEDAGLTSRSLESRDHARMRDVGLIWRVIDEAAGKSWSRARILTEATALLTADPKLSPEHGPGLAVVTGHEGAAEASFLRALPRFELALAPARPVRAAHIARVSSLYGDALADTLRHSHEPPFTGASPPSELHLLAAFLFEVPQVLAAAERLRSAGPDGTVDIEEHAGVEDEIEAAVAWVTREIFERRTPLEEIGLVVPQADPLAGMLADRIASLPWAADGATPVHVVRGWAATATPAAARIVQLLRALRSHLHIDVVIELAPILRLAGDARLSRSRAVRIFGSLGTLGGTGARKQGALDWLVRVRHHMARSAGPNPAASTGASPTDERAERDADHRKRLGADLDALLPALTALSGVAEAVLAPAPITKVWELLHHCLAEHVRLPPGGIVLLKQLDVAVRAIGEQQSSLPLSGDDALAQIETLLEGMRVRTGRFGEAAITIATLADAAWMDFRAVRVLGLAEGQLPSVPREDAVLPDAMRAELGLVRRASDRALAQLHAMHRVVRGAGGKIALSAARMDLDGTYREPSAVLLEVGAALGRPHRETKARLAPIPGAEALRRDYFEAARSHVTLRIRPLEVLAAVARGGRVPPGWRERAVVDPVATMASSERSLATLAGLLQATNIDVPGILRDRPISASRLQKLLECPHRFLLEGVLGWCAPAARSSEGTIEALSYGSLFHATAEAFYGAHGAAFGRRELSLERFSVAGDDIANAKFAELLEEYALSGAGVRKAEMARLRRDLRALLEHDWNGERSEVIAVERPFGYPEALAVPVAGTEPIHVHGYIDRIDRLGERSRVWDLKTGRAHPRETDDAPDHVRDIQLALYSIVTRQLAPSWGIPTNVMAAYVYPSGHDDRERSFAADGELLERAGATWLATSASLLRARSFPRTPEGDDCTFCAFKPVCGKDAAANAARLLAKTESPELVAFRTLKEEKR